MMANSDCCDQAGGARTTPTPCLVNFIQPLTTANLFYLSDPAWPWTRLAIRTKQPYPYDLPQISNNTFHGDPRHTADSIGLDIHAGSGGVIAGNLFSATTIGIQLTGSVLLNNIGTQISR